MSQAIFFRLLETAAYILQKGDNRHGISPK